jgi:DNA polymerase II
MKSFKNVPMLFTGWVLDLFPAREGIEVWFRTAEGGTVTLLSPFCPSFAVAGRGVREAPVRAAARRWGCSLERGEGIEFFSGKAIPAWTIAVPSPALLRATVRKAETAFGPEALWNADIAPEQQFAYATGLFPLARATVECAADGRLLSCRILDSPRDVDPPLPFLSAARLAVEGTGHPAHGRTRPLLFTAEGETHELLWEDGEEFLREFARRFRAADPDLLVTEYGDDHILPRMLALSGKTGVPLPLGRVPRPPGGPAGGIEPSGRGAPEDPGIRLARERSYVSYGRVVFRAAPHTFRGRWHIDARNSFLFGETGLPGLIELARFSGIPLQRLARSSPGTAISAMQVAAALARGILVPYKKREPETFKTGTELVATDKGGLTYLPRPGWHENVAELDFASMYPSLMERYNISPETIRCRCCAVPGRGTGIPVPGIGSHTCSRRRGLVPEVLSPILEKRRLLKERQRTAAAEEERGRFRKRQTALKWILVVCFGFLGYRNARFGRIEAHEAVTAWGREKLLSAKEIAERQGFLFLHGLTDAVWVARKGATEEDCRRLADTITAETGMPIALEGIYRWIAFLPSKRNPAVAVPNRFAGAFADGTLKVRGIALRRSDTPPFVARFQRRLLERMTRARNLAGLRAMLPELRELAESALLELREGALPPEELAVARRLSKAPERYTANTAAAAVARELCGRGVPLRPGSKIRYLLTEGAGNAPRDGRAAKQQGRAAGFLDGSESPDLAKYGEMLREAAEEVLAGLE